MYARHRGAATRGFLVALFPTLLLLWLIDPATMVHRRLKGEAYQPDSAYVGFNVARDYDQTPPAVVFLGGSSMREATLHRRQADAWLSARCSRSIRSFNAATSSQDPLDSWAIADAIDGAPRVIVVGLSYRRFMRASLDDVYDPNAQTVALPSSRTASLKSLLRGDLRAGVFDFFNQFERAQWSIYALGNEVIGRSGTASPARDNDDRDDSPATPIPADARQFMADEMYVLADDDLLQTAGAMTDFWLSFAREMGRRGSTTLFVMTPYGPEAGALAREYAASMDPALDRLARENPVVDLRKHPGLTAADFTDPTHLSDLGRTTLWLTLGEAVARAYGCPPKADSV
jgi:hypothetical protein